MTITLRSTKGSALTYGEVDGNFTELDNRTAERWQNLHGIINIPASNAPTETTYKGIPLLEFSPTANQEVAVRFHLPHDFIAGTNILLHSHVVSQYASSGTIRWGFEYNHAGEWMTGDPSPPSAAHYFGASTTVYGENEKTALDQDLHRLVLTPAVTIAELLPDDVILVRYFRDATHINDTYPDPVMLLYVDLYYRSQGFGSVSY